MSRRGIPAERDRQTIVRDLHVVIKRENPLRTPLFFLGNANSPSPRRRFSTYVFEAIEPLALGVVEFIMIYWSHTHILMKCAKFDMVALYFIY